ncbi:MAG TPA: FAD-dependent oxidoreductase [Myxococcales bacterium]|jgi:protoporphyrinogen oxidase|nr:FAD-dependent oxidoreductase [Myxococcales bacterium]
MAHTLIVGGGLAGLSCARELGRSALLIEAEDRLGGLCRTDVIDGFSFDWTGHWLHARDPSIKQLIQDSWLAGNLLEVQRRAVIHSEGVWTGFPYQFNLHGLPPATIEECLLGFVDATVGPGGKELRERPLANAAEFILRHLGAGLARRFMFPYNEKLFTVPCEELSPEWGGRFIPKPTLPEIVRGAVGQPKQDAGYNASFWYPREGGIESLVRGISRDLRCEVRTGTRVERLDLAGRRARLSNGEELSYDRLVWTGPLPLAVKLSSDAPPAVREAAAKLRAVSVTVVEIGARDNGGERFHWAYFPEKQFSFYRVGSPSLVNPALAPKGTRSFAVEFAHRGPADAKALIEAAVSGLARCGLLDRDGISVQRARTIPTAYVLFDHEHARARATVLEHLRANGVHAAGRYGNWEYSSMEDALLSGRAAALAQ